MACRRRRCREKAEKVAVQQKAAASGGLQIDPQILTTDGEGCRLWRHVIFGTHTCLSMLAGYAKLGMPGDPVPELRLMVAKLNRIIEILEKPNED